MFEPVSYRLELKDYVRLNRDICARTIGRPFAITIIASYIAITIISSLSSHKLEIMPDTISFVSAFIIFLVTILSLYFIIPIRSKTLFREQRSLSEDILLVLHEDGLEFRQESGNFRVKWQHLVKWIEQRDIIAVFPSSAVMIWFTEQAIGIERMAYIRDQLALSGLPKPGKLRKAKT
jgi:hypothetical protein